MPKGQETTPFYIRTQHGETFHVDTLEEALTEFTGEDGYRLTLSAGGIELVIRRDVFQAGTLEVLGQEAEAHVTLRKLD